MCSMYWTLTGITFTCPCCSEVNEDAELQTHFMGEVGSCTNYYKLGEPVVELGDISGILFDFDDSFVGICEYCDCWFNFGANIKNGKVVDVWIVAEDE